MFRFEGTCYYVANRYVIFGCMLFGFDFNFCVLILYGCLIGCVEWWSDFGENPEVELLM